MAMREALFDKLPRPAPTALAGKRVLVLGLGDTGLSVAKWVTREGGEARIADTRTSPPRAAELAASAPRAELRTGAFEPSFLDGIDLLCLSPGVALAEPVVCEARQRAIPVLGDVELFAWRVRGAGGARVAAITGTNGKSTVTALAGHLLRAAGIDCEVAGNIGPAALEALMRRLDAGRLPEVWVLELSSYQLETTWALEPDVAAMLNLSEDHLDRYAGIDEYGAAKARIFFGHGIQVLNRDDARSLALALPGRRGLSFGLDTPPRAEDFGVIGLQGARWLAQGANALLRVEDLPLAGWHNVANALAAAALARALGVGYSALAAGLLGFRGLPHRLQRIALRAGVAYYDDSKGTNVGATVAALKGLAQTCVLIAGGDGKG
jgi:UDP-N-acetylmuramoylalanine--D-glutamate ligase